MKRIIFFLASALVLASCASRTAVFEAPRYSDQVIDLPGVPNARQLGGYAIGNKKVRDGVLIRSGALAKATDEAVKTLHDRYQLGLVADFRTSMERGMAPDREVDGAVNVWVPVLEKIVHGEGGATMAALHLKKDDPHYALELLQRPDIQEMLRSSYDTIVFDEDHQKSYASFLDSLVALPEGRAALWHCSHGKDRCGWGTAFVLAALGAGRDLIVADFEMSNVSYTGDMETLVSLAREEGLPATVDEDIHLLRGVSRLFFEKTLDEIDARYGSIDNFLGTALDLTRAEKRALRRKFLEAKI